jgi:hypothetical protein
MIHSIPYLRNKISTLLLLSASILTLLMSSPLPLSNFLLQPAQAQTTVTFKTPRPANGDDGSLLTFDAQGTLSINPSSYQPMNGTFQITSSDGDILPSRDIVRGHLSNNSNGLLIEMISNDGDIIQAPCSTSAENDFVVNEDSYQGAVECDIGGDTTAAQPSSSSSPSTSLTAGSSQDTDRSNGSSNSTDNNSGSSSSTNGKDSDSDGIPDSSDNCPHNSHHRCFKEGDASETTTHEQQQPSSNRTGNQTRQ